MTCTVRVAIVMLICAAPLRAQSIDWGIKGGMSATSVADVTAYYDLVLCCDPLQPDALVDAAADAGFVVGSFIGVPIEGVLGAQGEVLYARRRHAVDLAPYEMTRITFARDYVDAVGLMTLQLPTRNSSRVQIAAGPSFSFRLREGAVSTDPRLKRGDPETDLYVLQALPYSGAELLRRVYASAVIAGGFMYRRLLVEVRFTQGLQSIMKEEEDLLSGFVQAGGHEPTLRRIIPQFGRPLESAKSRDLAVLAGFRF